MEYCRVCHKQKPAYHFEDYPEHSAQGPKLTLAQRQELAEDERQELASRRARADRASSARRAPGADRASRAARIEGDELAGIEGEGEGETRSWAPWALAGAALGTVGLIAWQVFRNGGGAV